MNVVMTITSDDWLKLVFQSFQEQQLSESLNSSCNSPDTSVEPATMLKGLSQDQMVALLAGLMEKRPEIKEDVRNLMPEPDLIAMEDSLNYLVSCLVQNSIGKT